jgi:hypothetical protein
LALNKGQLSLGEMQVDKDPFPVNVLECNNLAALVRPEKAKSTAEKNVVIGEPRRDEKKYPRRQVALKKDEMGKNKLTITIGPSSQKKSTRNNHQEQANGDRAVLEAPQTSQASLETGQSGSIGLGGSGGVCAPTSPNVQRLAHGNPMCQKM